jgi:uncharacterized protein YunC (DUF1805 family)
MGLLDKRKNNMSLITGLGNQPLLSVKEEARLLMTDALNVVKIKANTDSIDRLN